MNDHADIETPATARASRATGRKRFARNAAAAAMVLGSLGVGATVTAAPASASPWDPHVALTGAIQCPAWGGPYDTLKWAWVEGNNENSWAWLGSGGVRKPYRKDFYNIPYGRSVAVHVTYGCAASGTHHAWFQVSRPTIGSYTTFNISR